MIIFGLIWSLVRNKMSSNISSSGMMSSPASKTSKKVAKKDAVVDAPVVAAPAPVVATPAPVAEATPAKRTAKRATKTETVVAPAPEVVTSSPVETVAVVAAPVTTLDDDLKAVSTNLNGLRETTSTLLSQIKKLEKRVHREMKEARKRRRRVRVDENGNEVARPPCAFEIPNVVSQELLTFLGRPSGTQMSRSEVTKAVNEYLKTHSLKHKHEIKPDVPLRKLLAIGEGEPLTYFNLQKYLNRHYIKNTPASASASATA